MERAARRRVILFCALACTQAWIVAAILWRLGGLTSPAALPLMAIGTMGAPTVAHVLTRLLTREGWRDMWLRPRLERGWPYWLLAWFGVAALVVLGMAVYLALFPQHYDRNLTLLSKQMPPEYSISPWVIAIQGALVGLLISPFVNGLATFGEEFGWRGYLFPRLMALGPRKAVLISGAVWGVWHAPYILMGHNYGLDYPGAPWLGPLAMVWFCLMGGTVFAWLTWKAGSVWPAVIGHAVLNGMAGLPLMFIQGEPNPLLGPTVAGVIGGAAFAAAAVALFVCKGAWAAPATAADRPAPPEAVETPS